MSILTRHPKQSEYDYAHMLFKILKAQVRKYEDTSLEERLILYKYFSWAFTE